MFFGLVKDLFRGELSLAFVVIIRRLLESVCAGSVTMADEQQQKRFGIRVSLPADDPMRASHLLGDWFSERWYGTAEERDRAYETTTKQLAYYRRGDIASQVVEKVER